MSSSATWSGPTTARSIASSPFLIPYLTGRSICWVDSQAVPDSDTEVIVADRLLQDAGDYRGTLQAWFNRVGIGGHLVVVVPHAFLFERQSSLPSRWHPGPQRLYTPALLLSEVEEALVPNSYRVRWLGDLDAGYDYEQPPSVPPGGESDVAVVIERIAAPAWALDAALPRRGQVRAECPDYRFEPERTRIEIERTVTVDRMLILKLDHLGDLIMATPALRRLRRYFPEAVIDLAVGSWNVDLARTLGVADQVIGFDAFPRNSSEAEANVDATLALFRQQFVNRYDLAIDLRADVDTRPLLRAVKAPIKAGLGTRARFPYLDIALPLDNTRNEAERAREDHIACDRFAMQGSGRRRHFGLYSDRNTVEREHLIIWGPFLELDPGDYIFDFHIDIHNEDGAGVLSLDVALDRGRRVGELLVSGPGTYQIQFRVDKPRTIFEARIATYRDEPTISFGFHGGTLIKKGPGNVLHQSEYAVLLAELVRLRMLEFGLLDEQASL